MPVIREDKSNSHVQNFIDRAQEHFDLGDNKAAGVYLRSAFEFILKRYCFKKQIPVAYHIDPSKMNTDVFWKSLQKYKYAKPACGLTTGTINSINHYKNLVLNPLSHHDINKHEITAEIQGALVTITTLKTELNV
jgi:hypothetical protein